LSLINDLLNFLQNVLDDALEGKPTIKECFMDLGLFFEDKEIPVAALIDMWTELNNLDDDNIEGMNFVHELDNLHLVNLAVSRYIAYFHSFNYSYNFKLLFSILISRRITVKYCLAVMTIMSIMKQKNVNIEKIF
jgi:hypothetical protein